MKSIFPTTLAVTALAGILAVNGCAGTNEKGGKGKQALVCPQCKMVAMTGNRPSGYEYRGGYGAYGDNGRSVQTVYNDTCPGCQSAIKTLLVDGRTKYECSICKGSPYICPVSHPVKNPGASSEAFQNMISESHDTKPKQASGYQTQRE